jgi:hypothetical protein
MVKASDLQLFEISLSANVWNLLILKAVGSGHVVSHGVVYMMMIHGPVIVQFGSSYLDVVESLLNRTLGF